MREASKSHQIRIKVGFLPRKPTLIPVGSNYGWGDTARGGLKGGARLTCGVDVAVLGSAYWDGAGAVS